MHSSNGFGGASVPDNSHFKWTSIPGRNHEINRDATGRAIPDLTEANGLCFELGREGTPVDAWPVSMLCP